jgi:ABC-type phosphate/phosphonate transport system substrate-binding protein
MTEFVAALPMYDWPETRAETDAEWARLRELLRADGVEAPERLARRNADLPPVPGGIRNPDGAVIAPDPATLPPDEFDLHALWRHPGLLLAQTCWGPLEQGLDAYADVVCQPSYDRYQGGQGECYSSAIVMRKGEAQNACPQQSASAHGALPLDLLMDKRFAFNNPDSMSGIVALARDLEALGCGVEIFRALIETGGHRASVAAVAEDRADVAALDCRTWSLVKRFEPDTAEAVEVVAWTAKRKGLPLIVSKSVPCRVVAVVRSALRDIHTAQHPHVPTA